MAAVVFFGLIVADALDFVANSPPVAIYMMMLGIIVGVEKVEDWLPRRGGGS